MLRKGKEGFTGVVDVEVLTEAGASLLTPACTGLFGWSTLSARDSGLLVPKGIFLLTPETLVGGLDSEVVCGMDTSDVGLAERSGVGTLAIEGTASVEVGRAACTSGTALARDAGLREFVWFITASNPTDWTKVGRRACAALRTSTLRSSRVERTIGTQLFKSREDDDPCSLNHSTSHCKRVAFCNGFVVSRAVVKFGIMVSRPSHAVAMAERVWRAAARIGAF